jgi:hypothetical protein
MKNPSPAIIAIALLLQACGPTGAALFHGDRITVERNFVYLDDPVFLQSKSAYGRRTKGYFSFRLPVYFNAGARDTLRFGPGGISVRTGAKAPLPDPSLTTGRRIDTAPTRERPAIVCAADTGASEPDSAALAILFLDTGRTLILSPGQKGKTRIELNIHCREYDPPWGRTDTLSLAFQKKTAGQDYRDLDFRLPFHVSYRGPVVSILVGLGLLYLFTQLGWLISYG